MSKQFLAVLAVIVLIFVGIFVISNHKSGSSGGSSATAGATNHVEGQGSTGVTLVEYGDYECPFCGEYFPTVKQVQADYNTQITFQFRNFPLVNVHQNAFAGARAAEAASLMGKFWEMHDLLYENQTQWSSATDPTSFFDQYATQLGLNLTQFKQNYASSKVNDAINADMAAGNKLNVAGTPTFYLDGKAVQVANSEDAFKKVIDAEIAKKAGNTTTTTPAAGTTEQTKQ